MSLIKRKQEPTTVISVRIPLSLKAELESLRKMAEKANVDFTATLAEMIAASFKGIRSELEALDRKPASHINGAAAKDA
jgi:hypothetical protein